MKPSIRATALALMALACAAPATADDAWLRVYTSESTLRSQLAADGIDYGTFVWLPETATRQLPESALADARVQRFINPYRVRIDDEYIDPAEGFVEVPEPWRRAAPGNQADFRLVQFQGPIKSEWLQQLRTRGIEPIQYMAPFSYIVWATPDALEAGRSLDRVRHAGDLPPVLRVPVQARRTPDYHSFAMAMIHGPSSRQVIERIRRAGVAVTSDTRIDQQLRVLGLGAAAGRFLDLARIPGVLTVQQIGQDAGPRGEMSQQSVVGNYDETNTLFPGYLDWLTPTGLDGSGVVVGIVDGGIHESHPDLVDNMVACSGSGPSCSLGVDSHGTHVAGAVAGTGASGQLDPAGFLRGQGVAPGASLVNQRYGPLLGGGPGGMAPAGMLSIYRDSADSGASLTNNSWGPTGSPQGYDIPTMEIDFVSRDADPDTEGAQPVLAVWSIMNGYGDRNFGTCQPSSLGSPDEAKNLFAVGSTRLQTGVGFQTSEIFDISSNSAHGPACDGRIVPHIVAPGCTTDAPDSAAGYGLKCGTSMASPVVSGGVALFWEKYRKTFGSEPSPALVKAAFTPVAMNLEGFRDADGGLVGARPNRKQGWGRLDLDAVINPPFEVRYFNQQTVLDETGDTWEVALAADDPAEPVRLMLAWTDAPGAGIGGTSPAWVNDLDLIVESGQTVYLGNVFGNDGFSEAGGSPDGANNLEGVFLAPDQHAGQPFAITISAANLAEDALDVYEPGAPRQDFALVCYNCKAATEELFSDGFETP